MLFSSSKTSASGDTLNKKSSQRLSDAQMLMALSAGKDSSAVQTKQSIMQAKPKGSGIPKAYYDDAKGLSGYELKTALSEIISEGHHDQGYGALWSFMKENDLDEYYENDGTILDIYSENPSQEDPYNFTAGKETCGNYKGEGSCYNREHSFPKSWFNKAAPMVSDVHHIYPTDGKVNGMRGNYPYGEVGSSLKYESENGSLLGQAEAGLGYKGTVFEPIDEFKGDLARSYFYMATRYEDQVDDWKSVMLDGSKDQVFEDWSLEMLLKWNEEDPVSLKEIARNNAAYDFQGNRNPFVDHPEYIEAIWGED